MTGCEAKYCVAVIGAALLIAPHICAAQAIADSSQSAMTGQTQDAPPPPTSAADAQELAKHLSNPVSSLISVPFQENIDFGAGARGKGVKSTLDIQPVVPVSLSQRWNVIVRTILPVIAQNNLQGPGSGKFGLGDTVQSFFFSPKKPGPGGIIWGAGPVFLYPSATDRILGNSKWGAGPTIVLLKQSGKNTFGFLGNHIWSVAGETRRPDISATFLQPFISHTTARAMSFTLNTETTYNWKAKEWIVPINLTVAQLTKVGKQRVQIGIGGRYYAAKPVNGPNWGLRTFVTLLFPKK